MSSEPIDADTTDDGVLTPEELQLHADDDHVDELGENRYVIRSGASTTTGSETGPVTLPTTIDDRIDSRDHILTHLESGSVDDSDNRYENESVGKTEREHAHEHALESASESHGIDVTLKIDGELAHLHTTSNDVREVFAEMLTWYADQLDDDLSPAEALQVMLATTELEI